MIRGIQFHQQQGNRERRTTNISIAGIDRTVAQDLVQQAEQLCPYSKATRGNIDVTITFLAE